MIHSDSKRISIVLATLSLGVLSLATALHAGLSFGSRGRTVGGVVIDPAGMVRAASLEDREELANQLQNANQVLNGDLREAAEMRMVSLKGLQAAVAESHAAGKEIPAEAEFMAGLQRIEYVFVDQQNHDVIVAGPAEPWKMREDGFVVGTVTGGATMRLADLTVALRSVENARQEGITCSIEPTEEGRRRLQQLLNRVKLRPGQSPVVLEASMREAFGPQMIYLSGIPTDSRFARTLVAADFEMKRVAMGLTPSPVATLPSYLEMSRNSQQTKNQNPRWWMACNYDSLGKSEDGLAWKLSGQGVQTMTEQDVVNQDGSVKRGGVDKMAKAWADKMTESYGDLSRKMPVFSELQNMMDLTVVATLIVQERLADKAGLDLSLLGAENDALQLASYTTPKAVEPHCSFIRGRAGWVVTASGGVDINGFQVVQNQVADPSGSKIREEALAASAGNRWWWNK
ncbi:MAG: DUF1598 domain-containing protein [Rubripirellula sp.]|nr:DUF1598 domain-containing protein [Rubripirellula sp.]